MLQPHLSSHSPIHMVALSTVVWQSECSVSEGSSNSGWSQSLSPPILAPPAHVDGSLPAPGEHWVLAVGFSKWPSCVSVSVAPVAASPVGAGRLGAADTQPGWVLFFNLLSKPSWSCLREAAVPMVVEGLGKPGWRVPTGVIVAFAFWRSINNHHVPDFFLITKTGNSTGRKTLLHGSLVVVPELRILKPVIFVG